MQRDIMIYQNRQTAQPWALNIIAEGPKVRCRVSDMVFYLTIYSDAIATGTHSRTYTDMEFRHATELIGYICGILGEVSEVRQCDVTQIVKAIDDMLR